MSARLRAGAAALMLTLGGVAATDAIAARPASAAVPTAVTFRGRCEAWVKMVTHNRNSYPTAMAHWRAVVRMGVARRGGTPPAGAIVFWNVARGLGHVGISVGGGRYRDYAGVHTISSMPNYLGWAPAGY